MNKYDSMTNPELNRAIAERMGYVNIRELQGVLLADRGGLLFEPVPNFAGDMNAAMELVDTLEEIDRPFDLHDVYSGVERTGYCANLCGTFAEDEKPARAIAICYLLYRDATDAREADNRAAAIRAGEGDAGRAGDDVAGKGGAVKEPQDPRRASPIE